MRSGRHAATFTPVVVALAITAEASAQDAEAPAQEPVDLTQPVPAPKPAAAEDEFPAWLNAHDRRCGFSFGLRGGALVGAAEGFPNDSLKIDRFAYFTETGVSGGGQGGGWIGVALVDWLVFGVAGHGGRMVSGDHRTDSFGGAFHIDVFPLYALGDVWTELGVNLDVGVAFSNTTLREPAPGADADVIESGGASRVGVGLFYEGIRLWKLSMGPYASYDQIWSRSAWRPTAWIGWRTAFYLGPR